MERQRSSLATLSKTFDFTRFYFYRNSNFHVPRYFYGELHQLAHGLSPIRNIFIDPHNGKLHLRNSVSIHLVLSDAPNGDAKEFLPSDTNHYLNAYDAVRIY